jgi:hypothetical protein
MNVSKLFLSGVVLSGLLATGASDSAFAQYGPGYAQPGRPYQTPVQYRFGERSHSEQLAADLVTQANNICVLMHNSFQRNPGYRETYRDMYDVLEDAQNIRAAVREGVHRGKRRSDDRIAKALHHMDDHFHRTERQIRNWRSTSGPYGSNDSAALRRMLDDFENTLHHMMEDYGEKTRLNPDPRRGGRNAPPPHGHR